MCLNELLREEKCLLTQIAIEQRKYTSLPATYLVQGKARGWDMSVVQCFRCKGFGHFALYYSKKFYNYCKKMVI